jgi:threonine/homoserine/homoserine lactone efflux protein
VDASFLTFLAISAVVIATPGPDTALTIRNALQGGRRGGIFTALGVSTGQLIWAVATSLGLVALLLASEPVFHALKLVGAAYLVYLAARGPRLGGWTAFRQGVINDLANPKMAVFFASVLPQFAPQGHGMLSQLVGLGLVFAVMTFAWLALYATAVAAAGAWMRGSGVRRAVDALAGTALVALGVRVAAADR